MPEFVLIVNQSEQVLEKMNKLCVILLSTTDCIKVDIHCKKLLKDSFSYFLLLAFNINDISQTCFISPTNKV